MDDIVLAARQGTSVPAIAGGAIAQSFFVLRNLNRRYAANASTPAARGLTNRGSGHFLSHQWTEECQQVRRQRYRVPLQDSDIIVRWNAKIQAREPNGRPLRRRLADGIEVDGYTWVMRGRALVYQCTAHRH